MGKKIPPYFYHATGTESFKSIQKQGLIPLSGKPDDRYLCMSASLAGATTLNGKATDVIFRVETKKLNSAAWEMKGAGYKEWRGTETIPPENLYYIYNRDKNKSGIEWNKLT